jgi:FlaA1/EpsC-like NDP-sugar epimerase
VAIRLNADVLIVAIPSASSGLIRELDALARAVPIEVLVLPPVSGLLGPHVTVGDLRELDVSDLLGRHPIDTDIDSIAHYLTNRRVLVTGAGGSIGSELCRQLSRFGPERLVMLDRDESALHQTQLSIEGRALLDSPDIVLADIRDGGQVERIMQEVRPHVVFHAAALKHMPLLERFPAEAVKTNIWGTQAVLTAAAAAGVERFINISTDKAANPLNALGCSKRIAERLTSFAGATREGTFISVRFGNVLGSRGSVLTSFKVQIANGGPLTVTHPDVTRYFMTVEEAVQLVIQAGAIGRTQEVLVLDMGEPVRIADVARQLARAASSPIDIVFTGLRPGEKLHEQLFDEDEEDIRLVHPLIAHVPVPPLEPTSSRVIDASATPGEVIAALQQLCREPTPDASVWQTRLADLDREVSH